MIRLGILGSTRGTAMLPIIDAIQQKTLTASIEIVISNKKESLILQHAKSFDIPTQFIDARHETRELYDEKISALMQHKQVDVILLIGYMRILTEPFVKQWENKMLNIHPSLLPAFAGKMDLEVHRAVIAAGVKETGCTVHYVTTEVDAGPILLQKKCSVLPTDTAETLKARVQSLEGYALVEAVTKISLKDAN